MSAPDKSKKTVLLVGDVMRDVIVRPEGTLRIGSDRKAQIEILPGGSAANQAMWLAANNIRARLVARVGGDDIESLRAKFIKRGVEPIFTSDTELVTGTLISMIGIEGERSFYTDRGANEALSVADLSENLLDNVSKIVLSGYSFFVAKPREVAKEVMALAEKRDIPVLIDPASTGFIKDVGVSRFLEWTRGAAVLFPNTQEAELLSGETELEAQLKALSPYFGRVVIKLGALGAATLDGDNTLLKVAGKNVAVLDTTGAGDAFAGGFVAGQLGGLSLLQCLQLGNEQGARAVAKVGGQP